MSLHNKAAQISIRECTEQVEVHWSCQSESGTEAMRRVPDSDNLWESPLPNAKCRSGVMQVQVCPLPSMAPLISALSYGTAVCLSEICL